MRGPYAFSDRTVGCESASAVGAFRKPPGEAEIKVASRLILVAILRRYL